MAKNPDFGKKDPVRRLRLSRLAWLPIPLLLGAMLVLWAAALPGSYEWPHLVLALNFVFSTLVSLFIAYLVGRSFLARSTPGLLLLGCGVIFWGLASVMGTIVANGDVNISITIHNSCVWLSALCHLAGVVLSLRPRHPLSPTPVWLAAAYLHVAGAVGLIALAAHAGWTPTFFVQGQGGTPLRQLVLISAIVMFGVTALLLRVTGRRPSSAFARWYALALTLIVVGLFGVTLQSVRGGILGWTGRATQLLGSLYMLIAAVASVRESHVWEIPLDAVLRGTRERLRLALEAARMGTWDWDIAGGEVIWNEEHYRILGYEPGRVKSSYQAWAQRVHPDNLAAVEAVLRRSMEQCADYVTEYRTRWPDGTVHWAEVRGRFEAGPDGTAVRSYGVLLDITERKKAEAALRDLTATLENKVAQRTAELQRRAGQLQKLTLELSQAEERERRRIAVILHEDLQQQIAGAKFHLSLLKGRAQRDLAPETVEKIDQMLKGAIDKSRSLSHDLSPAVLHLNDLTEVLQWLANRVRAQHGLAVTVDVDGVTALQSEAMTMFLFRAAQEMLFNVVKHARVKEAAIRVRRFGRHVGLRVSDRGQGFDPQELQETPGLGLLSIRERVELLGGRMSIKSIIGQGSRCHIVVPDSEPVVGSRRPVTGEEMEPADHRLPATGYWLPATGYRQPLRVLLADDHEIVRQGLRSLLREAPDIEVVGEASNGHEAVDLALTLRPDVLIVDVSMPILSGDEAARQIKRRLPQIRIVALSMSEETETIERMYRAGAESYVLKTAPSEELLAAIRGTNVHP